jgi:hypothetical protein
VLQFTAAGPPASWPTGFEYFSSDKPKSDLYLGALPLFMSAKVDLLDDQRLIGQLCGLERRTGRTGKDSVDHRPGARDDVANAVCGVLRLAREPVQEKLLWPEFIPKNAGGIAPHLDAAKIGWPEW